MYIPTTTTFVQLLAILCRLFAFPAFAAKLAGVPTWHPRSYAAPRAPIPIEIDGDIYKKVWEEVPWSHNFVEIRGTDSPDSAKPTPNTQTRVKMRWDDDYLYIAAEMTAHNWPITAEFTKRNEPIYQKDSDIEVFLDADESNSDYKELEVNAKNTVWNLLLNRPYSSNGAEHSGRVAKPGDPMHWDVKGQKTAAKMFGAIGKPQPNGKWTAEIALSHKDSLDRTDGVTPAVGKFWRINFSRVEKKGDVNWVWSPQMVWSPAQGKYVGQVNMHAPDAWGYVVFTEAEPARGPQESWVEQNWKIKAAAHQLFYAETLASKPEGGGKLLSVAALQQKNWISANLFQNLEAEVTQANGNGWTVSVKDADQCISTITHNNIHSHSCPAVTPAALLGFPVSRH